VNKIYERSDMGSRFICKDCGCDTVKINEYYAVTDEIWNSVVTKEDNDIMLCIGCLEKRMGRQLNNSDFKRCPANIIVGWDEKSPRLIDRITNRKGRDDFFDFDYR
jgi:hypothetical protein